MQKATHNTLKWGKGGYPSSLVWSRCSRARRGPRAAVAAYLIRSAPGCRPRPDGESEGTEGPSGGCSGRGDGSGATSSAGGAGGCTVGGVQEAFLPADEPLRATQEVSMTLTPTLGRDTKTPAYPRVTGQVLRPAPTKRTHSSTSGWESNSTALAPSWPGRPGRPPLPASRRSSPASRPRLPPSAKPAGRGRAWDPCFPQSRRSLSGAHTPPKWQVEGVGWGLAASESTAPASSTA